ncbi:unnamed protein product [Closterium sp. NIES-54]
MKPPVPPALKPAPSVAGVSATPTPDLVSCEAPTSLLSAPSALVAEPGPPAPVAGPAPSAPGLPAVPVNHAAPPAVADPGVAPLVPELPTALPAAVVPVAPNVAIISSPMVVSATTGGQVPTVAPAEADQVAPVAVPEGQQLGSPFPGQLSSRPHSPALREERESLPRRRDSPRRNCLQANWHAQRGGRGGWAGCHGYDSSAAYVQPISLADVQRVVSEVMGEERAVQRVVSEVMGEERAVQRLALAPAAPPLAVHPMAAAPPRQAVAPVPLVVAPAPPVPAASAAARDRHLRLFTRLCCLLILLPRLHSMHRSSRTLPGPPRTAEVPEATLAQLWRLYEGLCAVHLIQVYGHAALFQGNSLDGGPQDECLDAADRLAELLAPMLAAPAQGVIAGVGQLGTAVCRLKRVLRTGTGDEVIGASAAVVRELHRSPTGLLAVLDADQF